MRIQPRNIHSIQQLFLVDANQLNNRSLKLTHSNTTDTSYTPPNLPRPRSNLYINQIPA